MTEGLGGARAVRGLPRLRDLYVLGEIVAEITRYRGLPRRDQVGQRPAHLRGEEILDARHGFSIGASFVVGFGQFEPLGQLLGRREPQPGPHSPIWISRARSWTGTV